MKIQLILIPLVILFSTQAFSECIHERKIIGAQIVKLIQDHDVWIKNHKNQFLKVRSLEKINPKLIYQVQYRDKKAMTHFSNSDDYNDKYLEYYSVKRLKLFIKRKKKIIENRGYKINTIGLSVKGEDLFYIGPQKLDYNKKTIVMFGRHHGDEGTANWIIEGFANHFFHSNHLMEKYNLLLYPMVNPDGANARTRYNANGRDLNRSWGVDASKSYDEIVTIYSHLEKQFTKIKKPVIALDMHGSFTRDFIFRVDKSFKGLEFYNLQQNFISRLAHRDQWQKGRFVLSNGDNGMARIRLINRFGLNAMTHETPRDIPLKNSLKRSVRSLMSQGVATAYTIDELY